jgi:hypothetical protein
MKKGKTVTDTNGHIESSETIRNLKCTLTPDETRIYGQDLAKENASRDEAEERKKEIDAQLKAEIESHSTKALSLARKINNGYEYRDVKCEIIHDYREGTVTTTRLDTKENVEHRVMTAEERQTKMELQEAP